MTRLITVAALFAAFAATVCAQSTQKKSDGTATTAAPPSIYNPVPKDAVKNADGTWSYTDKQGKRWVYVTTPFGVRRTDVTDEKESTHAFNAATKVIDKGDTVRFEQPGPFGPISWEKKKADLTDPERQMIDAQKHKQTETAKPDTK